jgi:thiol:disulfide interchange protein DsbD
MQAVSLAMALLLVAFASPTWGQAVSLFGHAPKRIALSATLQPPDVRAGEGAQIVVTARIDAPYHMYSLEQPAGGPVRSELKLTPGGPLTEGGPAVEPPFKAVFDPNFKMQVQEYEGEVSFGLPVTLKAGLSGAQKAEVTLHYQLCNQQNCMIPQTTPISLDFTVAPGAARPDHLKPITAVPPQTKPQEAGGGATGASGTESATAPPNTPNASATVSPGDETSRKIKQAENAGLFSFIGLAFGAGFLALTTPCVFPMIPITVSFFAKRKQKGGQGLRDAFAYCLGIIGTFTVLGVATAVLFKASGIRAFANNPWVNVGFAILFVVLAINLMGGFEISAPVGLANKVQAGTQRGGFVGPFLMGLTFTLTSFTCTVAFVGTLLAAAAQGSLFYPIVGMLAFSTAFALPFFLLALFPQFLARLPKSGSWLITVKGFMGFVELAAAVKFLSNADLVWDKGWLTRPVFLAIWAGISVVAGLYLLGALRLPHDDSTQIGWARRSLGGISVVMGLLFLAGINGAALGTLVDYLPPSPYPGQAGQATAGPSWLHDYAQARAQAQTEKRPLVVNFTGVNCTNCRDMEQNVFPLPDVARELDRFIRVELYTDRERPDDERNAQLMQQLTGVATLPVYAVVSPEGKVLKVLQDRHSPADFIAFLKQAQP